MILWNEEYNYLSGGFESYDYDISIEIDKILYKSIRITEEGIILYKFKKNELIKKEDLIIYSENGVFDIDCYIMESLDEITKLENIQFKKEIMEVLYSKKNKRTCRLYLYSYL